MTARGHRRPAGALESRSVVALGGGHGLAATLQALRRVTDRITAIVTVADDGGSSGRLREEFGVLPPGDLRMALAALCGDDTWGRTWERVVQHRFASDGPLHGHALGNLLITALWQTTSGPVEGLDWVGALLEAQGRVLPCSTQPLEIVGHVRGHDPTRPDDVVKVTGQVAVASTSGRVERIDLLPTDAPACPEALAAIDQTDVVVVGPGSWFTSVMPHLLIPDLRHAICASEATKILILNLDPKSGETSHFSLHDHVDILRTWFPDLRFDWIIADPAHIEDLGLLESSAGALGAQLRLADVAIGPWAPGQHDPQRLAVAFNSVLGLRGP